MTRRPVDFFSPGPLIRLHRSGFEGQQGDGSKQFLPVVTDACTDTAQKVNVSIHVSP